MSGIWLEIANVDELDEDQWDRQVAKIFRQLVLSTPKDTGNARDGWMETHDDYSARFWNDVDYVSYLEHGWSSQSSDMIQDVVNDYPDLVVDYDLGDPRT